MKIVIDINENIYHRFVNGFAYEDDAYLIEQLFKNGTPLSNCHERKFEEIVVEYPPDELCTYPEYRGKPYFSIMYEENGEHFIGFGTYKPDVLSSYIREYFIAPTIIEADKGEEEC